MTANYGDIQLRHDSIRQSHTVFVVFIHFFLFFTYTQCVYVCKVMNRWHIQHGPRLSEIIILLLFFLNMYKKIYIVEDFVAKRLWEKTAGHLFGRGGEREREIYTYTI